MRGSLKVVRISLSIVGIYIIYILIVVDLFNSPRRKKREREKINVPYTHTAPFFFSVSKYTKFTNL